ncbi:MAG: hypothetical protein P1P65_01770 [Treponema sp.]
MRGIRSKYGLEDKQNRPQVPLLRCLAVCCMLSAAAVMYGQESAAHETSPAAPAIPVRISAFKIVPQYYGLPVSVQFGWFYRKEDVSMFPHFGTSFLVEDEPVLNSFAGFTLRKGSVAWNAAAVYDIVPFTMHKKPKDQIVYGSTSVTAALKRVKIILPLRAGRQRRTEITGTGGASEKRAVTEVSAGIRLEFLLADFGFFKSTGAAAFRYGLIPDDRFHYYTVHAEIPASFHFYYADLAFMYSCFHTGTVQYGTVAARRRYETAKPQSSLTGRNTFKPAAAYTDMHIFGSEFRWYPARFTAEANGFFLSLFADAGIGITARRKRALIAEFGGGIGYTLFDSVPFTFQAGVNQDMQPVFYLGIVSRLSHRP